MSRLLRPSPGECADRQTILQIKMRIASQQAKPLEHFVGENNDIQRYLEAEWFLELNLKLGKDGGAKYDAMFFELEKVNQLLWDLEDEIRSLMALSLEQQDARLEQIRRIAFAIPKANDRRMELVQVINELFGIQTKEKIYTDVMNTLDKVNETMKEKITEVAQ